MTTATITTLTAATPTAAGPNDPQPTATTPTAATPNNPQLAGTTPKTGNPANAGDIFAEAWQDNAATTTGTPHTHERPAYPEPPTADAGPPHDAVAADVVKLLDAGNGRETLVAHDGDGRELHFSRDGLFRWATRTAETIVVEPGIGADPTPRRLWVRNIATGTWWTDTACARRVA